MQVSLNILFKLVQLYLYIVNAGVLYCAIFAAIVGRDKNQRFGTRPFFSKPKQNNTKYRHNLLMLNIITLWHYRYVRNL